jgi:uncharacterized protein
MSDGEFKVIVDEVKGAIPELVAIWVFGSVARGMAGPESDIDLALLAPAPVAAQDIDQIRSRLSEVLSHAGVDLIDLRGAPLPLSIEVLKEGKQIFCSDSAAAAAWEVVLMARYAHLNEERRGILEEIRDRGSVYGR